MHTAARRLIGVSVVALAAAGGAACDRGSSAAEEAAPGQDMPQAVSAEVEKAVVEVAEPAAIALRTGLSQRLMAALRDGTPERAIDVCALEALPLTDSIAAATGMTLKRTSSRIRNPHNAPDALEQQALRSFEQAELQANALTRLVQHDSAGDYRLYLPLRTQAFCLNCHGAVESLTPAVRRALEQRYPADRATGYAEDELRGLIRVSVPAAAVASARVR